MQERPTTEIERKKAWNYALGMIKGLQERLKRTSALETTPPSKTSQQKQKYMER